MGRRRRAVGFYTKGKGRRRKVIPITARSRYAYRAKAFAPAPRREKEPWRMTLEEWTQYRNSLPREKVVEAIKSRELQTESAVLRLLADGGWVNFPTIEKELNIAPSRVGGALRELEEKRMIEAVRPEFGPGGLTPSKYRLTGRDTVREPKKSAEPTPTKPLGPKVENPEVIIPEGGRIEHDELGYALVHTEIPTSEIEFGEKEPVAIEHRVQKIMKMIKEGQKLPPVNVFGKRHKGDTYQVFDGHARVEAHRRLGLKETEAEVTLVNKEGKSVKHPTNPKTHQHWMATDNRWWENIEHPISQPHLDVDSKRRHDMETGKFKRWAKRRGLKFTDATYELYEQKIKAELEAQKGEKRRGR